MAFKCVNCGHIFEYGEEKRVQEDHGEWLAWCPVCGGDFEEAERCKICGGEWLSEELSADGFCMECLMAAVNFDSFYHFAFDGSEDMPPEFVITLEDFVFAKILKTDCPKKSSPELREWCKFIYKVSATGDRADELESELTKYLFELKLWPDFSEHVAYMMREGVK